ncbi:MAG: tyrosine-type recombinase/integrase [Pirellulales bacterium]|nr:tyrosine-type recombinase/integrase [Pirellulales bacterium]
MNDEIRVKVKAVGSNRCLAMYYTDPVSGKRVVKSTGTRNVKAAERKAGEWENQLRSGQYIAPSKITWKEFRERYEKEKLSSLAPDTRVIVGGSMNLVERHLSPDRLCKLTAAVMSRFQAKLRETGIKETTIAHHLRNIKAALRWAERVGLMVRAPKIEMPKRAKGQKMMKGRPITGEEFDRMMAAVPKVRPVDPEAWERFLRGLWLSGLRLNESLRLSWDFDAPFAVDLSGRRPVFRIKGEAQKSGQDQLLPMAPDFAQWLLETFPEAERAGRVFRMPCLRGGGPLNRDDVGRVVSAIGKKAGVVVDKATGKYATAHDLRRSFGTRWAPKVMPADLQLLMRHAEISTTLKYYVAQDAEAVADRLWANFGNGSKNGNTLGNTVGKSEVAKQA